MMADDCWIWDMHEPVCVAIFGFEGELFSRYHEVANGMPVLSNISGKYRYWPYLSCGFMIWGWLAFAVVCY